MWINPKGRKRRGLGCGCVNKYKEEEAERDWMVVERRQGYGCVDKCKEE